MPSSIELQDMRQASLDVESNLNHERKCSCPQICTKILMVAIPTLIVSGVLIGIALYGMDRMETFASNELDSFLEDARSMLSNEIEMQMTKFEGMAEAFKEEMMAEFEGRVGDIASHLSDPLMEAINATREQWMAELQQAVRQSVQQGIADALNQSGSPPTFSTRGF